MSDQVDQFGRDKSKTSTDYESIDKSKKILDSLAEIKNQLENKNYTPKVEVNNSSSNKELKMLKKENSNFEELYKKIEYLEKKIINLSEQIELKKLNKDTEINIQDIEGDSIFHNFDNEDIINSGRSLLVLEEENQSKFYKIKFHHFLLMVIFLVIILILLTSFQLKVNFIEVINLFLLRFN